MSKTKRMILGVIGVLLIWIYDSNDKSPKGKYEISDVDPQFIIQCCENCGYWRILLKKEE